MLGCIGKTGRTRVVSVLVAASFLIGMGPFHLPHAAADQLGTRTLKMSDAVAAAHNVTYLLTFAIPSVSMVGSIKIQFCSNTSLVDDACVAPNGFDASGMVVASEAGSTGYVLSTDSTTNEIILTRPPSLQTPATAKYALSNMINPADAGSYYVRILTYPSSDASGPYADAGGLAFAITPGLVVATEVPPFLKFCLGESITNFDCSTATEGFSDLGTLGANVTSAAQSQMVVATNASDGYSMWVTGNSMTSGNNVITPMTGTSSQKGTSQFGLNLRANTSPVVGQDPVGPGVGGVTAGYGQPNQFRFNSGDVLATATQPDDTRKYTVSYIVNIPPTQPGGVYSTTVIYICLANF